MQEKTLKNDFWVATGWSKPGSFLKMTIHDFVFSLTFCKFCCDGFARSLTADKSRQLTLAAAAGSLQPRARPAAPAATAGTIVTTIINNSNTKTIIQQQ